MDDITLFFQWFFDYLPDFLLSNPIKYFIGFFFFGCVISIIRWLVGGFRD